MSVGFGFSVGDFIAALQLVSEIIDALRESGDAAKECRQLLRQLIDLETALLHVRRLELDDMYSDQVNALKRAASQCRDTIDEFMIKVVKYQPHILGKYSSKLSYINKPWYKVKWALCRREDVEKFKADVMGHTEAINILMNAIQIQQLTLTTKSQNEHHSSLKATIESCFTKTMQKLSVISDLITTSVANSKGILEVVAQTARIDCRIFSVVLDIQSLLKTSLPSQILYSQPVYLIDALGKPSPFHLEFIRSAEALLTVLQANFKELGNAKSRIRRGDFVITDVPTKRDIDLSRPWHTCFRPGQRVDMSMILNTIKPTTTSCPNCHNECSGHIDTDVECTACGLTFRRIGNIESNNSVDADDSLAFEAEQAALHTNCMASSKKRKREDEITAELAMYRKVRIRLLCASTESPTYTQSTIYSQSDFATATSELEDLLKSQDSLGLFKNPFEPSDPLQLDNPFGLFMQPVGIEDPLVFPAEPTLSGSAMAMYAYDDSPELDDFSSFTAEMIQSEFATTSCDHDVLLKFDDFAFDDEALSWMPPLFPVEQISIES